MWFGADPKGSQSVVPNSTRSALSERWADSDCQVCAQNILIGQLRGWPSSLCSNEPLGCTISCKGLEYTSSGILGCIKTLWGALSLQLLDPKIGLARTSSLSMQSTPHLLSGIPSFAMVALQWKVDMRRSVALGVLSPSQPRNYCTRQRKRMS